MDPAGVAANAAHLAAAADCLHLVREAITITAEEASKGHYPLCDLDPVNGTSHTTLTQRSGTFYFCKECFLVMCTHCNLESATNVTNSLLFITSFNFRLVS
jgi:hypothetical protein